jgi:hypothetical protein
MKLLKSVMPGRRFRSRSHWSEAKLALKRTP